MFMLYYLIDRTLTSDLELIGDHVTKSLIVDDAEEDVGLHFDAVGAGIHRFGAVVVVAGRFLKNTSLLNGNV